ncbi:MAG: hypothetical protein JNL42_00385 [Anaerolineae bacterium]|nr:hypothetical protein [Anaerolineae bacterium]
MRRAGFLIASAAAGLLVALGYVYYAQPLCEVWCDAMHTLTVQGAAPAPFRFRLLATFLAEAMPGDARMGMALAHFAVAPAVWVIGWLWLEREVGERQALVGVVLLAAMMLIGYYMYGTALYSLIELGLLALGLLYLQGKSPSIGYALLVIVGTINRETTGLLLLMAAVSAQRHSKLALFAWISTMAALRVALGLGTDGQNVLDILQANLSPSHMLPALLNHAALLPFVALAALGWRSSPPAARRRLAIIGLPYAAAVLVFGYWDEVRLWLPIGLLALPMMVGGQNTISAKSGEG